MEVKQFKELADAVIFHGFDAKLLPQLSEKISAGEKDFELVQKSTIDGHDVEAKLRFHRSDKTENVYFNNYLLTVSSPTKEFEPLSRFMQIEYKRDFTLRELYNLMMERSVSKKLLDDTGQEFKPWVKMDFTATPDKWGNYPIVSVRDQGEFEVKDAIAKFPILYLEDGTSAEHLKASLERGNSHSVVFLIGDENKVFRIEADPVYKGLIVRDPDTRQQVPSESLYRVNESRDWDAHRSQVQTGIGNGETAKREDRSTGEPGEPHRQGMKR